MAKNIKREGNLPFDKRTTQRYIKKYRVMVEEIAENSLNHFLEGFQKGGYQTDDSRQGWQRRKSSIDNAGRAILVKTGALRNDIDIQRISKGEIVIGTTRIPYAEVHNEGGQIPERRPKRRKALKFSVGNKTIFAKSAKGFKMPKREFLGHSQALNAKNKVIITKFLKGVFKT